MAPAISNSGGVSGVPAQFVVGLITGTVVFVAASLLTAYLYYRHRRSSAKQSQDRQLKQFLLPKNVKPVISFKTAAGPGGLKKSPSPVQSPDNPEHRELITKSMDGGHDALSCDAKQSVKMGGSCYEPLNTSDPAGSVGPLGPEESGIVMDEISGGPELTVKSENGLTIVNGKDISEDAGGGFLNFNLKYNFDKNALMVTIVSAQDLPVPKIVPLGGGSMSKSGSGGSVGDPNAMMMSGSMSMSSDGSVGSPCGVMNGGTLDPYVKLQLLPEKQHKVKTRVVRNTLNPVYDEEFTFYGLNYNQLQSTTLHFALISFDRYSRDEIIGEVLCPLFSVDLGDSEKEASLSLPLMTRNLKFQNATSRGELLFSLCYQSSSNKLTAVVMKARNLPKFDVTGLADPYVKVYLLYKGQRIAKKKSHVKKRTLNPVYNESFMFDIPTGDPDALNHMGLEFFVMDWDRLTKNEVMGCVEIGARVKTPLGRSHWSQVLANPRKPAAEWHKLRA